MSEMFKGSSGGGQPSTVTQVRTSGLKLGGLGDSPGDRVTDKLNKALAPLPPPSTTRLADVLKGAVGSVGNIVSGLDKQLGLTEESKYVNKARGSPGREGTMIVHSLFPGLSPFSANQADKHGNVPGGIKKFFPVLPPGTVVR
jgi:hypothetical protein